MRIVWVKSLCVSFFLSIFAVPTAFADGMSLRVTPVSIHAEAPVTSGSLTMSNKGTRPMRVQVRVFKWVQQNGKDLFMPTKDVAVSPPMMALKPGTDSVIRVVRVAKTPVNAQESYRVVVDQLPDSVLAKKGANAVSFVIRHNIPVFFSSRSERAPQIGWSVKQAGRSYVLTATNRGNSYLRLSEVELLSGAKKAGKLKGLAGYVLAGSSFNFSIPVLGGGVPSRIQARGTDNAPINDILSR